MAEEYEKKTPVFDWELGDFVVDPQKRIVTATGNEAVEQIIIKAQQTKRGVYLIYADPENQDQDHKYGSDVHEIITSGISTECLLAEIKRATQEAVLYDPWVKSVTDATINRLGSDEGTVDLTVITIFDTEVQLEGVRLSDG